MTADYLIGSDVFGRFIDDDPRVVIDKRDQIERLRYTCPVGHIDWHLVGAHVWCVSCARHKSNGYRVGSGPTYRWVRDKKTGDRILAAELEVIE